MSQSLKILTKKEFKMKVDVVWDKGMRFLAEPDSGHTVVLDDEQGNTGTGPMEAVLVALGGCTGTDVVSILKKMRLDLKGLRIEIYAERAETHPRVYTHIKVNYIFNGSELPIEKLERAVQLSRDKYCSVMAMLKHTAKIETNIIVEP